MGFGVIGPPLGPHTGSAYNIRGMRGIGSTRGTRTIGDATVATGTKGIRGTQLVAPLTLHWFLVIFSWLLLRLT